MTIGLSKCSPQKKKFTTTNILSFLKH
uniref:Uncharacterized protein n=1 Tax=Rhizophora mucronata TaxID=61149 RepID=A0A2P2QD32_RHIMU